MRLRLAASLALALIACRGPVTRQINDPPPPPPPSCGDGLLQEGEDCDASDLGTGTCQALGFDSGRLVCTASCRYDTALCTRRCGNGQLDLGEACDGTLGVADCETWGFNACTDGCALDARRCVAGAFEAGPVLDVSKGGPAVLGDLSPRGPGDLVMAVPSFGRVEIFPWSMTQGFEAASSRKLSFLRTPREVELLDVNADQVTDVATVDADGRFDLLVFGGASYALQPLDAGCADAGFLPSNGVPGAQAIAVGCDGYFSLSGAGAPFSPTPGAVALTRAADGVLWADGSATLHEQDGGAVALPFEPLALAAADLDEDGDLDLAALVAGATGTSVGVYENTGLGYAARQTFSATGASRLRVADLDQDGRADLLWVQGEELLVRRNIGGFTFPQHRATLGPGALRSLALGDADGDGDLDVAATFSTGPDSVSTRLLFNRLR